MHESSPDPSPVAGGLSPREAARYHRHLLLPELGSAGQARLRSARVLLVGAGGLGAPAALYLAAAGIGELGLVDFDTVDVTNLQRQVLFAERDVGRSKLEAAMERLTGLNSDVSIVPYETRLDASNARRILAQWDVIVDGSDNFATRYLVNDACVLMGKPCVHGSIHRFEGQVGVFGDGGPCYRCMFPDPPGPGAVPNCAEAGVLGVLPGIVGTIQATETIKIIAGIGTGLRGRILFFDALDMRFREVGLHRNSACPVCGENPTILTLEDTRDSCQTNPHERTHVAIPEIDVHTLKRRLDDAEDLQLVDVREPHERSLCDIGGDLIPMDQIPAHVDRLDRERDLVIYCRTGTRSGQVVQWLQRNGFKKVYNLAGGLHAWSAEIDPEIPRY